MGDPLLYNRATAVVVKDGQILLIEQPTDEGRTWSLPGGKQEANENLGSALIRETKEETGLDVEIDRLLYVADHVVHDQKRILHITFKARVVGGVRNESNVCQDTVPIKSVRFIPMSELTQYGFTKTFQDLVVNDFPGTGSKVYVSAKSEIGL